MKYFDNLRDQRGASLVITIIATLIALISLLAVFTTFHQQQRLTKFLAQKQETIELKNQLAQQLSTPDVCHWQLKNKIIDVSNNPTVTSPSPTTLQLNNLYYGTNNLSAIIATAGQPLPLSLNQIAVNQIKFYNIYDTGIPDQYKGVFEISFQPSFLGLSLAPIQVQQVFFTDPSDPPSSKKITACKTTSVFGSCATLTIRKWSGQPNSVVNQTKLLAVSDPALTLPVVFQYTSPSAPTVGGPFDNFYIECNSGFFLVSCSTNISANFSNGEYVGLAGTDTNRPESCAMQNADFFSSAYAGLTVTCCQR